MKHLNGCPFFKCHKLFLLGRSFVSGLLQVSRAIAVASCPVVVFVDSLRQLSAILTGFFLALIAGVDRDSASFLSE
jgi:hypothetical protein